MASMIIRPYPKIGETFSLSINGDDDRFQPLAIVGRSGKSRGWAHHGKLAEGRVTRIFKFVGIERGWSRFDEILSELALKGGHPVGQWAAALKAAYPKARPDGRHIGIPDASWVAPDGGTRFPYIDKTSGELKFHRSAGSFCAEAWFWAIIVVSK
jgi:hypothetical protein